MDTFSSAGSGHSSFSLDSRLSTLPHDWFALVCTSEKCEFAHKKARTEPEKKATKGRTFCTDSHYVGQVDSLGFSGKGCYTYPHGVRYEGEFSDGQFHGEGSLIYPNGSRVLGKWVKGKMVEQRFFFGDGLEVTHPWKYLDFPDRTLHGEGENYASYTEDTFKEPHLKDCYDTRDGFYDPRTKCVHDKYLKIIRIVTVAEERQITSKFRAWVGSKVGYRPDFYERWTSGEKNEIELIQKRYKTEEVQSMSQQDLKK
ncbi:unnamed protein product [Callosobruchus maculatus]|uniref:MORN repeat-containing protein 5 n=1 Tax=Callosobruchus maculatus TaxID=64391 RepID=A0A653DAX7_CALMS|nr:unnamed protein product [Callosobruchus maculatus]